MAIRTRIRDRLARPSGILWPALLGLLLTLPALGLGLVMDDLVHEAMLSPDAPVPTSSAAPTTSGAFSSTPSPGDRRLAPPAGCPGTPTDSSTSSTGAPWPC